MTFTLADANRVIAGAIEKANQIGAKMNIAVCDAGGRLLAFQRMDGAMWAGSFAAKEGHGLGRLRRPSGELTPRATSDLARQSPRPKQPYVLCQGPAGLPPRCPDRCLRRWRWDAGTRSEDCARRRMKAEASD